MISKLKRAKTSWLNIVIGFCILTFVLIVLQNSAKADTVIVKPKYSSASMTEFVSQKSLNFFNQSIEKAKIEYENNFDMYSDYSFQKYISDKNLLNNKKYKPSDLVQVDTDYIVNRAGRPFLRQPAQVAFEKLAESFNKNLDEKLYLISAHRTYRDQETLFEGGCSSNRCAKIGGSEHQLGLAVDIHLATKHGYNILGEEYLNWMNENAHKYGFINTYRKGAEIDGKMKEVRHWRYVGIPLATELYKKDMSFAEYYDTTVIPTKVEESL
ncbi:MAG TPA: M15 family metallopeptidase [Candidatus Absconditabacterales bacterium]|nr:M15 family metallopeptidase [Candidatus Absconditabacterales bacterium]